MCGTLKYENTAGKIGKIPPGCSPKQVTTIIREDGSHDIAQWLGHIRGEKGPPALPHERVLIPAREYTEKDTPFQVPPGKAIEAYLITSPNYPQGEGVFIVTRPATEEELKICPHPRHPTFCEMTLTTSEAGPIAAKRQV
jgi:hypothetical protein